MKYVLTKKLNGFEISLNSLGLKDYSYTRIPINDGIANEIFSLALDKDCWEDGCRISRLTNEPAYDLVNKFFTETAKNNEPIKTEKTKKVIVNDGGQWCLVRNRDRISLVDRNYGSRKNSDTINASYYGRVCIDDYTGRLFWKENPGRVVYKNDAEYTFWLKNMEQIFKSQQTKE